RANRETMLGDGIVFAVATGAKIKVEEEKGVSPKSAEYIVIGTGHSFSEQQHRASGGGGDDYDGFGITIEAVPAATHERPPRDIEKPTTGGLQIATVVGVTDKVIDVDEYGRVRVHFDWDRGKRAVTTDAAAAGAAAGGGAPAAGASPSDN